MQTWNTIFTMTMLFVTIPSQVSASSDAAICRLCGVIIQASRLAQRQEDSRKRGALDHGIHNHVQGTTSLHGEHYGVPRRQGRARNTIFRGPLRGTGLAEAVGSTDRARQTLTVALLS